MKKVSVCIPVYESEKYLFDCLTSIGKQSFSDYEIIIINDCSTGVDNHGRNCQKIIKEFKKDFNIPLTYIEHSKNLGVLEARRRAVEESDGVYILTVDSDDILLPDAINDLYMMAEKTGADIVHGSAEVSFSHKYYEQVNESDEKIAERKNKLEKIVSNVYEGQLENKEIFNSYIVNETHCGYLWSKLIKKDTYLKALDHIPSMFCVLADDIIQYFWISYFAKKYVGISKPVYKYNINTGISSHTVIKECNRWRHVCSSASVFSALFNEIEECNIKLSEEESEKLVGLYYSYVGNNLIQWNTVVAPEIKEEAYNMLCYYWGDDIVTSVKNELVQRKLI